MTSLIKYIFLLFSFLTLTNGNLLAQSDSLTAKNTIFAEALGIGIIGSINYDRLIFIQKLKFSYLIGGIFIPLKDHSFFAVPVGINYVRGKKNNFEVGIGFTYLEGLNEKSYHIPQGSNFSTIYLYSKAINFSIIPCGYRFQKPTGGLFFRTSIGITKKIAELNLEYRKVLSNTKELTLWPIYGISIGYTFKKK